MLSSKRRSLSCKDGEGIHHTWMLISVRSYEVAEVTETDWALVYEIQGSNPSLKPLFLTAHQDVVPVLPSTRSQWTHDPYGGEYDGTVIHGRGASDTKSSLIGKHIGL